VPGYDTSSWFAFFVPAKTPPEIIAKMHTDTVAGLPNRKSEPNSTRSASSWWAPRRTTGAHLKAEMERWAPVIKAANIRVSE